MTHTAKLTAVSETRSETPGHPEHHVLAVTVIGDDRPGIIAELTAALASVGGNLEDSTMTLLRGHFAMVVLARTDATVGEVEVALAPLGESGELSVDVRAVRTREASGMPSADHSAYLLRVHGADRPGIVAAMAGVVAQHHGNIVDLGTRLGTNLYILMAEVVLPSGVDPELLRSDLARVARELGVDASLSDVVDDLL